MASIALPWLPRMLEACLSRIAGHATLLYGSAAAGQLQVALALAEARLCEARKPRACGVCRGCRLIASHSHPDLLVLVPEAADCPEVKGNQDLGDMSNDLKPHRKRKLSQDIRIDALRQAISFVQQTSARGQARVVIIHPAENMNEISANALLKTLEEPPGNAHFILSTGAPHRLLPTVRSRCQAWRVPAPHTEESIAWLTSEGIENAEIILKASGGTDPLWGRDLALRQGVSSLTWANLPKLIAGMQSHTALLQWPPPVLVDALQKVCHDTMCIAVDAAPRYFPRSGLPVSATSLSALVDWSKALMKQRKHAEHPWAQALIVESLLNQGKRAMRTCAF